ncbi:hypothetical protein Tco_0794271 [Tanacetum coccineum]
MLNASWAKVKEQGRQVNDEASYHKDASDNGTATNKPKQQQQLIPTTTTISNIKLPILKKEEYDIWAIEMEHYLEYIDNDVWKVIQNGNSKKRISTGKDGVVRVLPPVSAVEFHAEFEGFTISSSEGLEKGYDRFQQLLSQLEVRHVPKTNKYPSKSSASCSNVAYLVLHSKSNTNKVKSGHTGANSTYTPSTSLNNIPEREVLAGFADEVIYSFFAHNQKIGMLHEDLEQIDDYGHEKRNGT